MTNVFRDITLFSNDDNCVNKIKIGRMIIFKSFQERLLMSSQILSVRLIVSERTESFAAFRYTMNEPLSYL